MGRHRTRAVAALTLIAGALLGTSEASPLLWPRQVGGAKAGVAVLATLLLGLAWWRRRGAPAQRHGRAFDAGLALLGVAGLVCWTNLLQWNYPGFAHPSDTFHYYLGAKYFPELGYTRLYDCVAVADAESGASSPRRIRDLTTNTLVSSEAILASPERCKSHFDPSRWQAFRRDVDYLRGRVTPARWTRFQQDHGYNATPWWTAIGRLLASTGPASDVQMALLRALDPLLLALLAAGILWAFGWRIACVAAVYWGTNYLTPYGWTGGSILRQDWLAASVLGICALRRERPATAGALLALATLSRLFPAMLIAGVALGTLGRWAKTRRIALLPAERRFVAGGLAIAALALPLSILATGASAWPAFAENSRIHLSTPLANHVGLRSVLSYDAAMRTELARDASLDDPMQPWKRARSERFARFALLYAALVAGFAALVARAAAMQPLWVGALLGVASVPVAAELTAYYWALLLALAFAWERQPVMGPAVCGLAAAGWGVASLWHWTDQIHVWISVVTVAFSVFSVLLMTPRQRAPAAEPGSA